MRLDGYEQQIQNISLELTSYLIQRGAKLEVAEDVVQDIFIKVLEMDLILPPAEIKPYMYQMAKHQYIDYCRRQQRFQTILEKYLRPAAPQIQTVSQVNPLEKKIVRAIKHLPRQDQQLLIQKYIEKRSIEEIAEIQQKTPAAIKMRLYRLRQKLRKKMRDTHG
ncbi:RNA polymerase sigma factor [Lentilactobacillus senioris]|uniref:RNA polymerase sigma factor n=1 Tax=Lentilactobacillus senioris TaxID=931534 RepID=UPI00227EAA99|nr:RNA polymerase sigma factor [Lentilactobacillus senioris]MCY9806114.1 RNA polymerase sigma factor [Lentilactobacillus senioris]